MKRVRERLDAELEEIHKQLVRLGTGGPLLQPSKPARSTPADDGARNDAQRITIGSSQLIAAAFQLAGYVVATLALGRSIPGTIVLEADAEYDVGRCSSADLDTIWAVGNLAAARGCGDGYPRDGGPSIVIFKVDDADDNRTGAEAPDREQTAQHILKENWHDIVRVSRLLVEQRTLSRAVIEAEVFESERP
jgi:hypothetical protein